MGGGGQARADGRSKLGAGIVNGTPLPLRGKGINDFCAI
jgi:hypothetical protein